MRHQMISGILLLACVGCGLVGSSNDEQAELNRNCLIWRSQDARSYVLDFRGQFGAASLASGSWATVEVRDDSIQSVVLRESGKRQESAIDRWFTVEEMFTQIRELLDQDPDVFEVRYDSARGYPQLLNVDVKLSRRVSVQSRG